MASFNEISPNQLARLIGTPDAPVLVDVQTDDDFAARPVLIPGAVRWPFDQMGEFARQIDAPRFIVYCQKGLKLSQGAAAILRDYGKAAETLEGGHLAWVAAGLPTVAADKLPSRNADGRTVWVSRHRPKIDRVACPWLIRRFIDPKAQFLFVAPSQVLSVAERFSATPFDIEDVFWSHRGERCTFDTMLDEFALKSAPLARVAQIVRGADTNQHALAPEAAGLLAVSLGLSRMYRDDLQQLEAGMLVYDALYRWARDAFDEGHDWPAAATKA